MSHDHSSAGKRVPWWAEPSPLVAATGALRLVRLLLQWKARKHVTCSCEELNDEAVVSEPDTLS
jgi:hypothetical protein